MTNKQANEILHRKFPNATIYAKNKMGGVSSCKYGVTYEEYGRVYSYYEPNYTALLVRLKCLDETALEVSDEHLQANIMDFV